MPVPQPGPWTRKKLSSAERTEDIKKTKKTLRGREAATEFLCNPGDSEQA